MVRVPVDGGGPRTDPTPKVVLSELPAVVERTTNKDQPNGYLGADASGFLKNGAVPPSVGIVGSGSSNAIPPLYAPAPNGIDDTTNLQAVLTTARISGGGEVTLQRDGQYSTSADLVIGSNTKLNLNGATITRQSTTTTVAVIKNYDQVSGNDADIQVFGGTIARLGNNASPGTPWDNGIQMYRVQRPLIRNVRVTGAFSKSMMFYECLRWKCVDNWMDGFYDNGMAADWDTPDMNQDGLGQCSRNTVGPAQAGTLASSSLLATQCSTTFSENTIIDAVTQAFEIGGSAQRISILNNRIRWSGAAGVNNHIFLGNVSDALIAGNTVENGWIRLAYYTVASDLNTNVSIIGNHVDNTGNPRQGILVSNAQYCQIVGNHVIAGAIYLGALADGLVEGNMVRNAPTSSVQLSPGSGSSTVPHCLRVRVLSNAVVNGNATNGAGNNGAAFVFDTTTDCRLIGNSAWDNGTGFLKYGRYFNAGTGIVERDNDFSQCVTGAAAADTTGPTYAGGAFTSTAPQQATTATAGTAVALPATPQGYVTFVDSTGTTRKIPYYPV